MASTLTAQLDRRHVLKSDPQRVMAKASLPEVTNLDPEDWKRRIADAVRRTRGALSQKEFADLIDRDTAQVSRWEKGEDRPQFDAIFAVPILQTRLVEELARLADDIQVETVIRIRRRA